MLQFLNSSDPWDLPSSSGRTLRRYSVLLYRSPFNSMRNISRYACTAISTSASVQSAISANLIVGARPTRYDPASFPKSSKRDSSRSDVEISNFAYFPRIDRTLSAAIEISEFILHPCFCARLSRKSRCHKPFHAAPISIPLPPLQGLRLITSASMHSPYIGLRPMVEPSRRDGWAQRSGIHFRALPQPGTRPLRAKASGAGAAFFPIATPRPNGLSALRSALRIGCPHLSLLPPQHRQPVPLPIWSNEPALVPSFDWPTIRKRTARARVEPVQRERPAITT